MTIQKHNLFSNIKLLAIIHRRWICHQTEIP